MFAFHVMIRQLVCVCVCVCCLEVCECMWGVCGVKAQTDVAVEVELGLGGVQGLTVFVVPAISLAISRNNNNGNMWSAYPAAQSAEQA